MAKDSLKFMDKIDSNGSTLNPILDLLLLSLYIFTSFHSSSSLSMHAKKKV